MIAFGSAPLKRTAFPRKPPANPSVITLCLQWTHNLFQSAFRLLNRKGQPRKAVSHMNEIDHTKQDKIKTKTI